MGFFSKSKQETTTNTSVVNQQDYSSQLTQDSFNTISSVSNTDNSVRNIDTTTQINDAFKTVISQPIAFMAGGGSDGGLDLDKFFSPPTDALNPSSGGSPPMKKALILAAVAVGVFLLIRRFAK